MKHKAQPATCSDMEYKPPTPAERIEQDAKYTAEQIVRDSPKFKREVERIAKAIAKAGKRALKAPGALRNVRSA